MTADTPQGPTMSRRLLLFIAFAVVSVVGSLGYLMQLVLGRAPRLMVVTSVDAQGRLVSAPRVEIIPRPEVVPQNGMDQLEPQVARVMASNARFSSLLAFTPDGRRGFGLHRTNGQATLALNVEWRQEPQRERAIRSLFAKLKIAPTQDYLAGNGWVPDATRILDYPLSGDSREVAAVCKRVLREIYAVTDEEGLNFTFQESP